MDVRCKKCTAVSRFGDTKIPLGRSYMICPSCNSRINIFNGAAIGSVVANVCNLRFLATSGELEERFAEAGELWRVVNVVEPCPDKGKGRSCEAQNRGRCPNQRLIVRLSRDTTLYKTCLYRFGRRIFDKSNRVPVGSCAITSGSMRVPTTTRGPKSMDPCA